MRKLERHLQLDGLHFLFLAVIMLLVSWNVWLTIKQDFQDISLRSIEIRTSPISTDLQNITSDIEEEIEPTHSISEVLLEESVSDEILQAEQQPELQNMAKDNFFFFTIAKGDTLYQIFNDSGISAKESSKIFKALKSVFKVSNLQIGDNVEINFKQENDELMEYFSIPSSIVITHGLKQINIQYNDITKKYETSASEIPLQLKHRVVNGKISDSLYNAAVKNNINVQVVLELIKLFNHSVDFQREVKKGDEFSVVYDYLENEDGSLKKQGKILYASLKLRGKKNEIFRFENEGKVEFYDRKGNSILKTLLHTPISGARISSKFGMRKHPILGYSRMHKGLDYAAPTGTPIYAAGDGVVVKRATTKGYGRFVKIKHTPKYSTLYAHMSRFAVKPGAKVSQGDIIGYVGSTGQATGPHLHYEVIVNGKQVNPANVTVAKSPPLSGAKLSNFNEKVNEVDNLINGVAQ